MAQEATPAPAEGAAAEATAAVESATEPAAPAEGAASETAAEGEGEAVTEGEGEAAPAVEAAGSAGYPIRASCLLNSQLPVDFQVC
ncbi:MAG: hypothetical protein U0694_04065 [Anaerolineae bacterium]